MTTSQLHVDDRSSAHRGRRFAVAAVAVAVMSLAGCGVGSSGVKAVSDKSPSTTVERTTTTEPSTTRPSTTERSTTTEAPTTTVAPDTTISGGWPQEAKDNFLQSCEAGDASRAPICECTLRALEPSISLEQLMDAGQSGALPPELEAQVTKAAQECAVNPQAH